MVVTVGCAPSVDCAQIERQTIGYIYSQVQPFEIVPAQLVRLKTSELGHDEYSPDLRVELAAAVDADAILEIEVTHRLEDPGSLSAVTLNIVRPDGSILLSSRETKRVMDPQSSPEQTAREIIMDILDEAFEWNDRALEARGTRGIRSSMPVARWT